MPRAVIVGSGVFGAAAAVALAKRELDVTLIDPGAPHPDAASTDISKIVRLDYGADAFYTEQMERALAGWRAFNRRAARPLFHETGFAVLTSAPMAEGSFEHDSFRCVGGRGHRLERLHGDSIRRRFPAFGARLCDGYYNPQGGWAESGEVVSALVAEAKDAGVTVVQGRAALREGDAGIDAVLVGEAVLRADVVVVAAGAWTPILLPQLASRMRPVGQPVLHFAPADPSPFAAPALVPWAADIGRTGWYGFCANADGIVKVANHGPGHAVDPRGARPFPEDAEPRCRAFLRDTLPALADAPVVHRRSCLYCDSFDGDLWIDRDPERPNLVVAAGGSGHGFKFAPLLGDWIAGAVDGRPLDRFRWREPSATRREQARFRGDA